MRSPRLAAKAAALLLAGACLSACGAGGEEADGREADPMVQRALNDPLMADPDLVSQNMANAALKFEIGHPLPPEDTGQSAVIAARGRHDESQRLGQAILSQNDDEGPIELDDRTIDLMLARGWHAP